MGPPHVLCVEILPAEYDSSYKATIGLSIRGRSAFSFLADPVIPRYVLRVNVALPLVLRSEGHSAAGEVEYAFVGSRMRLFGVPINTAMVLGYL